MKLQLITTRSAIRGLLEAWVRQYPPGHSYGLDKDEIQKRLASLDLEKCSVDDVDRIIGSGQNWTRIRCDNCSNDVDAAILLGQEPYYDSPTAVVCRSCLQEALQLIQAQSGNSTTR